MIEEQKMKVRQSTILIVEDNKFNRELLADLLQSPNYNLIFAVSGEEALEELAQVQPDLILLDIILPGIDGFEVCEKIRNNPALAEVPIIMVTALNDRDSRLKGITSGADDFITKPIDEDELKLRVKNVLQLNRFRRLIQEQEKFKWVVERSDDGFVIVNASDQIVYANKKGQVFLGISADMPNDTKGTFQSLAHAHYHLEPKKTWLKWFENHAHIINKPLFLIRPESDTSYAFWLQVDIFEHLNSSEVLWLLHLRNVTEQISMHEEILRFHSLLSHKLLTPLTSIIGGLNFIKSKAAKQALGDINKITSLSLEGAERLNKEIRNILQYLGSTRVEKKKLRTRVNQIPQILDKIKADMDLEKVSYTIQSNLDDLSLELSEHNLETIFRELIENSRKFHPQQNPTIGINVSSFMAQEAILKISDDGVTLSPDQLEQVWTPYYQAEKYFTGQVSGAGLGLSLVAFIIWNVGGAYVIYNRLDSPGIVVELKLPLTQ
ncbi:response regulator [candidate division CSSED10-310 bacterium]|uniref:histidine kinase n=1 Tax=candidate division CSSED10-310 bacterium TaxID=2855610 RepID=A0ABV6YZL5_UNCC1